MSITPKGFSKIEGKIPTALKAAFVRKIGKKTQKEVLAKLISAYVRK